MSHTNESIKQLLATSNAAVERALVVLLSRQTSDEVASQNTKHRNGRGFSAFDAEILTSFATQIERKLARGMKLGECLSEKQMAIARKRVPSYAGQLAEEANAKAAASQPVLVETEVMKPGVRFHAYGMGNDVEAEWMNEAMYADAINAQDAETGAWADQRSDGARLAYEAEMRRDEAANRRPDLDHEWTREEIMGDAQTQAELKAAADHLDKQIARELEPAKLGAFLQARAAILDFIAA